MAACSVRGDFQPPRLAAQSNGWNLAHTSSYAYSHAPRTSEYWRMFLDSSRHPPLWLADSVSSVLILPFPMGKCDALFRRILTCMNLQVEFRVASWKTAFLSISSEMEGICQFYHTILLALDSCPVYFHCFASSLAVWCIILISIILPFVPFSP